jgi:DNA-binding MarR family transcriptional regulator
MPEDRLKPRRAGGAKSGRAGSPREHAQADAPAEVPKPSRGTTAMAVLRQFRELFRVSQQHFQRIEAHCGVSGAQLWALSELAATPGLTVSQLARNLCIHLSTSSNLLDKLEGQGLVRRERGSEDQRIVHVHLTGAGKRVLEKAPRPVEGVIPDALAKMPPQSLENLERELRALLDLAIVRNPKAAGKPLAEP